jgi:hypothetical protein
MTGSCVLQEDASYLAYEELVPAHCASNLHLRCMHEQSFHVLLSAI